MKTGEGRAAPGARLHVQGAGGGAAAKRTSVRLIVSATSAALAVLVAACGSAAPTAATTAPTAAPAAAAAKPTTAAAPTVAAVVPTPTAAKKNLPIKWIWTAASGVNAGTWTAMEAGYFKDEGLDAEDVHIASSSRAIPALIAGDVQFSNADGNGLVQSVVQGADVKAVVGETNRLVFSVMVAPGINSPQDMKGKKLGITRVGSSTHTAALQALAIWGLKVDEDVALVQLNEVPNILAALEAKQIDAGVVSPPTNTRAKASGYKELINLATDGPEYVSVTIATTNKFIKENPEAVKAFVRGYSRGVQRFKSDKPFAMKVLGKFLQLDDQAVLQDTWEQFSKYLDTKPIVSEAGMQRVIDEVSRDEPKARGTKFDQFVDMSAVKALDEAGFFKQLGQ